MICLDDFSFLRHELPEPRDVLDDWILTSFLQLRPKDSRKVINNAFMG